MKKYLMTGMAAVALCGAFTSCSRESDFGAQTPQQSIQETYETAFKTRFGDPAPEQNWGFGADTKASTRSGNMEGKERVAETSTGINANANEWADKADAPHGHGGWLVPPALTDRQKEIVAAYFQTVPNLTYDDPHFNNFFVQQVYKGDSLVKHRNTTEGTKGANGSQYASGNMNLLTVGANHQHINNFNCGNASYVNVLDSNYTVNEFDNHHHPDQIMLMVNIDDTQCMGYHSTGGSVQRDDKAALVGWQTIATWGVNNGFSDAQTVLGDGWNRSFVGFDLALHNLEESSVKDSNGNIIYAKMTDGQNGGLQNVWDGTSVTTKGVEGVPDLDLASYFTKLWNESESKTTNSDGTIIYHTATWGGLVAEIKNTVDFSAYTSLVVEFAEPTKAKAQILFDYGEGWGSWGKSSFSVDAGATRLEYDFASKNLSNLNKIWEVALQADAVTDFKISRIYLKGKEGVEGYGNYLLVDGKKVPLLDSNKNMYAGELYGNRDEALSDGEMKININGQDCFNMKKIADMVHDGYLPVLNSNLRTWVKFQYGDGYYSDWIVTLTEAKRQDENQPDTRTETESLRVIAEDLSVGENTDFDFNDVVFDVVWTKNYTDDQLTSQNVKVVLQAAGGTLPLYVAGHEVHGEFGEDTNVMINTKAAGQGYRGNDNAGTREIPLTTSDWSGSNIYDIANSIDIYVIKNETECHLSAPVGGIASKIGVKTNYDWCKERQDIEDKYSLEDGTSPFREWVNGIYPANNWYTYAKNEIVKYRAAKAALNGE